MADHLFLVIPAKAGLQSRGGAGRLWTPAFAGVTSGYAAATIVHAHMTKLGGCNG